jgi:DNA-binding beta-propeller fold protein YncE
MIKRLLLASLVSLMVLTVSARAQGNLAPLRLVQSIPMPTGFVHFDHFGVDAKGGRLFATFEDHNSVEVFDLQSGKNIRSIQGFEVPHNVLYLPDLNEVVITDGAGTCSILRGDTLETLHTVKLARNADFVVYDAKTQLFYVTNGGHAANMKYAFVSVIDANGKHLDDIKVDGVHIEFLTGERSGPRLFVNVADKHEVAVIDRNSRSVVSLWPLPDAEENLPLAVDEDRRRVFTVSRKPAKFFVLDGASGKVVTSLASVGESDDMAYDTKNRRIYVSGGEGFVSVFQQEDADHYTSLAKIPSGPGGNTSIFVPELNRLYVGVRRGKNSAELQIFEVVPK